MVKSLDERGLVLKEELYDSDGKLHYRRFCRYERTGELSEVRFENVGKVLQMHYDGFGLLTKLISSDSIVLDFRETLEACLRQVEARGAPAPGGTGPGTLMAQRNWEVDERGMVTKQVEHVFIQGSGTSQQIATKFWLDDAGRPEKIEEPFGLVRERSDSAMGVLLSERYSWEIPLFWELDNAGRPIRLNLVETSSSGIILLPGTNL